MTNFQDALSFSETHSKKRLAKAYEVFGRPVVRRLIAFVLFLLGAKREDIAHLLDMPVGTLFSVLTRVHHVGIDGFQDRRAGRTTSLPHGTESPALVTVDSEAVSIEWSEGRRLRLPREDSHQCRVVLLSLLENRLVSSSQVSEALGISDRHVRLLRLKLRQEGAFSLTEKRRGQQKEYRIDAETKGEIIQQFVIDVITGKSASGERLAGELKERCEVDVSARTIRLHLNKLGLSGIKESLPALLEEVKKNS